MKLIKENKVFGLLALVLFLSACHHISEREMAVGHWRFTEVTANDSALFPLLDTDFMDLKSDSTFHYEISLANKIMDGTWKYADHKLYLKYFKPDTTRVYSIEILSKYDLIFNENEKHFALKRTE